MGYIDEVFGIKSAKSVQKHIEKITAKDIHVYKSADFVHVIWSLGDKLHEYKIKCHVIYVMKEEELQKAVDMVLNTTNEYHKKKYESTN